MNLGEEANASIAAPARLTIRHRLTWGKAKRPGGFAEEGQRPRVWHGLVGADGPAAAQGRSPAALARVAGRFQRGDGRGFYLAVLFAADGLAEAAACVPGGGVPLAPGDPAADGRVYPGGHDRTVGRDAR